MRMIDLPVPEKRVHEHTVCFTEVLIAMNRVALKIQQANSAEGGTRSVDLGSARCVKPLRSPPAGAGMKLPNHTSRKAALVPA